VKIFSVAQIKKWDEQTILQEPVSSSDLLERAATACLHWLQQNDFSNKKIHIFCGKGNNGGDGLAIARMLMAEKCDVSVYIAETGKPGSKDFEFNLEKLQKLNGGIHSIKDIEPVSIINETEIIIDALLGSGLSKPVDGIYASLVNHINQSNATVISIDLPTGMFADKSSINNIIVRATHTISFQNYKLAFLLPENEMYCGKIQLLDIKLHPGFEKTQESGMELLDPEIIKAIYKPRSTFANKGNFGHAALVAGSAGMIGAAVLSSLACMRSGVGKLTVFIPQYGYHVLQTTVPEAMCVVAGDNHIESAPGIEKFDAVGLGPGIGIEPLHKNLLQTIFEKVNKPMVIDADALNIIAAYPELMKMLPEFSIITPHPKEFEKLFGKTNNNFERLELALEKSKALHIYIILKGHHSFISTPNGKGWFNNTGNAGMATAGSGDVLTGILTALLAQNYSPLHACLLAVYLHGLAGDIALRSHSQETLIAGDIIDFLGDAFKAVYR